MGGFYDGKWKRKQMFALGLLCIFLSNQHVILNLYALCPKIALKYYYLN